jgi:hypothetical protein
VHPLDRDPDHLAAATVQRDLDVEVAVGAQRLVDSIACALTTGSAPGSPRQTGQVCVLGSAPKVVSQPQNIFDAVPSSTCVSSPMTGSNSSSASV